MSVLTLMNESYGLLRENVLFPLVRMKKCVCEVIEYFMVLNINFLGRMDKIFQLIHAFTHRQCQDSQATTKLQLVRIDNNLIKDVPMVKLLFTTPTQI